MKTIYYSTHFNNNYSIPYTKKFVSEPSITIDKITNISGRINNIVVMIITEFTSITTVLIGHDPHGEIIISNQAKSEIYPSGNMVQL